MCGVRGLRPRPTADSVSKRAVTRGKELGVDTKGSSIAREEGRALLVLGEIVTCRVTAAQSGGAYSLFEVMSPPGGVPRPHIQHWEDECVYVIEGSFEFVEEGETFLAGPGSLVYVAKGNLHAYRNAGETTGRLLMTQTPGGMHERFFEEVGKPANAGATAGDTLDPAGLATTAAKYGIEMAPSFGAEAVEQSEWKPEERARTGRSRV